MTFLLAVGVGPALLMVLCAGLGLGVDRLAGGRLKGALIAPVGLAGLIVLGQFGIRVWAPSTPYVVVLLALAGAWFGRARVRTLATRAAAIPAAASVIAYTLAISPILLAGRTSMPTFLLDSSTGNHISGSHALLEHGPSMVSEPATSDGLYLQAYFGSGYPSGGHVTFGILDALVPGSGLWLWAPFLAVMLALIAPSVWATLRAFDVSRDVAAVGAVVASVPMITLAYAWMGAIKEVAAVPILALMAALVATATATAAATAAKAGSTTATTTAEVDDGGPRAILPLAIAAGAFVACVGVAGAAWVMAAGLALVVARFATVRTRPVAVASVRVVVGFTVATLAVCIPTLLDFSKAFNAAKGFSQSNAVAVADPGNLIDPLRAVQVLGTWIASDHRLLPTDHLQATYQFIGISLLLAGMGVLSLVRTRRWVYLVWLAGVSAVWWGLTQRGTIWTDAKLIVLTAPLAVTLVFLGIAGVVSRRSTVGRGGLAVVVAAGIVWSLATEYHSTNLLPTSRYEELIDMGDRIEASPGITYLTDFDEYAFAALPDVHVVASGFAYTPDWASLLRDGTTAGYGHSVDIDQVRQSTLAQTPWIIQRRRAVASRPPSNFQAVQRGSFYTLWKRTGRAPIAHLPVSDVDHGQLVPEGPASCSDVKTLAGRARAADGQLLVATLPDTVVLPLTAKSLINSPAWGPLGDGGFVLSGPGRMQTMIDVPASGRWGVWFAGDIARRATLTIDGEAIGSTGMQSGGDGNAIGPVTATMTAGRHKLSLFRGGGSLSPGDGQITTIRAAYLQAQTPATMKAYPVSQWRSLCGRDVDWIEAVHK